MKYGELVSFDPIKTVKVLTAADDVEKAREDVRTFVISDRMADQLTKLILPNLRFDGPADQRGVFVVGNYGTGKTHLMSFIAATAQHRDLLELVGNDNVREKFEVVAGRFHVIRAEIGYTGMSLRDIVATELEQGLSRLGVDFKFPDAATVTGTKHALVQMMEAFHAKYPEHGLFFVLDELLEYLRSSRDAELIQALTFLRELGEIVGSTRFRFLAGIQEAVFENPRFAGAADAVRRVKDRFEQVRIVRDDISFVVQERLLKKTTEQRDKIREHLERFTPLYEGMTNRLEDFVGLFPVHPAYIEKFEQITLIEKREILTTLSREIERLIEADADVPADETGLICYDSYRARLADDPSNRAIPEVQLVLDCSRVLRTSCERALARPQYLPVALRIIDGLTIHRLTTEGIERPLGATAKELRDDLALLPSGLPEWQAEFLEDQVEVVIEEIFRAVSGQFISRNPDNGEVYIDVTKTVDFDQTIEERATTLDDERLDAGYFDALERVLERREDNYVSGYRIWAYELPWPDRNVTRFGYLFMGAPNERSTAQPPRDFYIYFLQPYAPPSYDDERKADEVFFRLEQPDEEFTSALRRYAGAHELARMEANASNRRIYEEKRDRALQEMVTWLRGHMGAAVTATYRGETKSLVEWLTATTGPTAAVKQQIDVIASTLLTDHFANRYPGYPRFEVEISRTNLNESVRQTLAHIAGGRGTAISNNVLRSLELLDADGGLRPDGQFATRLLQQLDAADGKAANRADILVERDPGLWHWEPWYLEPIWALVVAAALTQLGRMELGISGTQIDALGLDRLSRTPFDELEGFAYIAPPKELPVVQLRALAQLLDLPTEVVPNEGIKAEGVRELLVGANTLLKRTDEARATVQEGLTLWGAEVVEFADERAARLEHLGDLLRDAVARNSVGKMNKLDASSDRLTSARAGKEELEWVEVATHARNHLIEVTNYLQQASSAFGDDHELSREAAGLRVEILDVFRAADTPPDPARVSALKTAAEDLRRRFADEAVRAHNRDQLDGAGDERKRELIESERFRELHQLADVSLIPDNELASLKTRLTTIGVCKTFNEDDLLKTVVCPECHYHPLPGEGPSARDRLEELATELEVLHEKWIRTLRENLEPAQMREQVALLTPPRRKEMVERFVDDGETPSPISDDFVASLNQVFARFDVRPVSPIDVWDALFPDSAPATPSELRQRFEDYVRATAASADEERVRFLPVVADGEHS